MNAEFLDQLAEQLKVSKNAVCRRAIVRILSNVKERWEAGEFASRAEAERAFRKLVDDESTCQKIHSEVEEER
jgi:hypothetical protein